MNNNDTGLLIRSVYVLKKICATYFAWIQISFRRAFDKTTLMEALLTFGSIDLCAFPPCTENVIGIFRTI